VVVTNVNLAGFFAVAPTFRDDLGLTKVETSALFAVVGVVVVLLAIPLGLISDALGARRIAAAAAVLLAASALGHAVAVDLWSLLAARIGFGLAFAGMLTGATAWLAGSVAPARRASALGGVMPSAGAGALIGPLLAGTLTDARGTGLAFAVISVLGMVCAAWILLVREGANARPDVAPLAAMRRAVRAPALIAGATLMLLGVVVDVVVNLLVPLQLDENGLSASEIGAVLSAGGVVYVVAGLAAARRADRIVGLVAAGVSGLLVAAVLVPLAVSGDTVPLAAATIVRGVALGLLFTVAFPLGALGAVAAGAGLGASNGLLMLAAGVGNAAGPLGGAAAASAVGDRWVYGGLSALCAIAGLVMLVAGVRGARSAYLVAPR
jgi:predicted MFS family arabinose efflux permease